MDSHANNCSSWKVMRAMVAEEAWMKGIYELTSVCVIPLNRPFYHYDSYPAHPDPVPVYTGRENHT